MNEAIVYAETSDAETDFDHRIEVEDSRTNFRPNVETQVYLSSDHLPAVYQSPVLRYVEVAIHYAGRHQPLPFPDEDD